MTVLGECVSVSWMDAVHRYEVEQGDDLHCVEAVTVGLVLEWTDDHIALAAEEVDGSYRGVTSIPWGMVHEVQVLATHRVAHQRTLGQ